MNFLVDECLPTRLAWALSDAGHHARHLSDLGLLGATDDKVMAAAAQQDCVLISADTDFGELLAAGRLRGPSLLLLRGAVHPPAVRAQLILDNLPSFADDLKTGAIVVITDDRIRVRSLPVGD